MNFATAIVVLILISVGFAWGFVHGVYSSEKHHLNACVAKYGDMPANKVTQYCTELLTFK